MKPQNITNMVKIQEEVGLLQKRQIDYCFKDLKQMGIKINPADITCKLTNIDLQNISKDENKQVVIYETTIIYKDIPYGVIKLVLKGKKISIVYKRASEFKKEVESFVKS